MLAISPKRSVAMTCTVEEKSVGSRSEKSEAAIEKVQFCNRFKYKGPLSAFNQTFHQGVCAEEPFDTDKLRIILALTVMIAYGAFVRTVLRVFKLPVPYTVLLFLSGMLAGYVSKSFCSTLQSYTAVGRFAGKVYLFCFLPILIFESAFAIRPHVFLRSLIQILLVALVGMAIATFMTAILVQVLLSGYEWSYLEASLFGSIISATDPVAVVAILRELGASEVLTVLIEGESLLNDGVAVLLFEVLEEITTCHVHENFGVFTLKKFCQVTLGGPTFGFFMGKATVLCLSMVRNDALVETSITLASAFLVYYIGEEVLGVSGIMALVVLGICLGMGRVYFSPKVTEFVHEFWEFLGYTANTILFIIVGIIVTETAFNDLTLRDWLYLLILYVIAHVVRYVMLLIMFPLLSRFGYGLKWKEFIVMGWSGLRGAVGLCLALEIFENKDFCGTNLGPKFLFQMSGLVLMTMGINATTFKMLLKCLKLTDTPSSKIYEMNETVQNLNVIRQRVSSSLKSEPFAKGAEWTLVSKATTIDSPFAEDPPSQKSNSVSDSSVATVTQLLNGTDELSASKSRILKEDACLAILRTFRISFFQQFHEGLLNENAMTYLLHIVSTTENQDCKLIQADKLKTYWRWQRRAFWSKLKKFCLHSIALKHSTEVPDENRFRRSFAVIATSIWTDCVLLLVALLHLIPSIWDCILLSHNDPRTHQLAFFVCNLIFLGLYIAELLVKLIGQGPLHYFRYELLNYIDLAMLILLLIDVIFYGAGMVFNSIYIIAKLIHPTITLGARATLKSMDNYAYVRLFIGYQIGRGFIVATDHVVQMIPRIIRHVKIIPKLIRILESEKLKIVEELDLMNKYHPDIVRAAKTHEASNKILHQMLQSLEHDKEEGLLDTQEFDLLVEALEASRKHLDSIRPKSLRSSSAVRSKPKRRLYCISNALRVFRPS